MKRLLPMIHALLLLLCACGNGPAGDGKLYVLTEMNVYTEDNIHYSRTEYTYDELGRLISERDVSNTGEETSFATVSYADTEAGLEIRYAYNDGHIATTRESRDEQGNLVLREFLQDDQMEYATIYTYDEKGNLICEETHYSDNPGVPRIEYTYDEQGNSYYDNRISVRILRSDGSVFFERTFLKTDFTQYISDTYSKGALLGVVFDCVDGDCLRFAASVGSPDKMSDEYEPLVVKVSRLGALSVAKDTKLDTASEDDLEDEDDGV